MRKLNCTLTFAFIFGINLSGFCATSIVASHTPANVGCADSFATTLVGTKYQWTFSPLTVATTPTNLPGVAAAFLTPGSHIVRVAVTTINGVVNDSLTISVVASLENVTLTASTNQICPQSVVDYAASPNTYQKYYFFVDDTLRQLSSSNADTVELLGGDSIQVFGFDGTCFTNGSNVLHVNFNPSPPNLISSIHNNASNDTICAGQQVVFTASPNTYDEYLFVDGGSLEDSSSSNTWTTNTLEQAVTVHVYAYKNGCRSLSSNIINIDVTPIPVVTVSASSGGLCSGSSVTVTANPSGLSNYDFFVNSASVQNGSSNTYSSNSLKTGDTVYVIGSLGNCPSINKNSIIVSASSTAAVSITQPVFCYYATGDTLNANPSGGNPGNHYLWSTGETTSSIILFAADTFSVTVTNGNNCTASYAGSIPADSQIYYTSVLNLFHCVNPAHGDLQIYGQYGGPGGIASLTYTVLGVGTNSTGTFPGLTPGGHNFVITDSFGCTYGGSVSIPASSANDSFDVTTDPATCNGFANGLVIITPKNPGDGPFAYQLDGGQFITVDSGAFTVSDTLIEVAPGQHTIIAQGSFESGNCHYDLSADVGQASAIGTVSLPDTIFTHPGAKDTVTAITTVPNPAFSWSPLAGLNCPTCDTVIISADTVNSRYFVQVYTAPDSSCYALDSVIIIVTPQFLPDSLIMPTGFAPTPNSPAPNQTFGPVVAANFATPTILVFRIYNRWGQLIHNANTYWDGRYDGKDQPVGTYIYYIEVRYANADNVTRTLKQQGAVTLLR